MNECLTCKKHYSQGGKCYENKKNCLYYDSEPRGKMVSTKIVLKMDTEPETPLIAPDRRIVIDDCGRDLEMRVNKINWMNLNTCEFCITAEYHENEAPRFERKKHFKVIKGTGLAEEGQ